MIANVAIRQLVYLDAGRLRLALASRSSASVSVSASAVLLASKVVGVRLALELPVLIYIMTDSGAVGDGNHSIGRDSLRSCDDSIDTDGTCNCCTFCSSACVRDHVGHGSGVMTANGDDP